MVSVATPVDITELQGTCDVLLLCSLTRHQRIRVCCISDIDSVVAFLPYNNSQYFIVEELGLVPENFEELQTDIV